ncbi:MAG TPA: hypothetical protein VHP14_26835, partial [Anaerolineales bacterium]|nr:hypothetical protein [Anaerolineales bacterium]
SDTDGIAEKAQKELEREEQEAERQNKLAALYAEAVRLLKEEKYQEALNKWQEVKSIDAKYPDHQSVQRTAKTSLASAGKTLAKHRIFKPTFRQIVFLIIVALTVIAVIYVIATIPITDKEPFAKTAGKWKAIDKDGSLVTLSITRVSKDKYEFEYYDARASLCNGGDGQAQFTGTSINDSVRAPAEFRCTMNPDQVVRIEFTLYYDTDTDQITDQDWIIWHRTQ